MENYLVADSYRNGKPIGEPFLKSGKPYIRVAMPCPRCGGSGIYGGYIEGGRCFRCGGRGVEDKEVRVYTEKEYAALQRQKERAREKKEEQRRREIQEGMARRHEIIMKFGFGEDEYAYVVYGGDTFIIKEQLKALGAHYHYMLKWYFSTPNVELPEGYYLCPIAFDDVFEYYPASRQIDKKYESYTENIRVIEEKIAAARNLTIPSEYYPAEIKERLRNMQVVVASCHSFTNDYGVSYIYTFTQDAYTFIWITSKFLDISVGDKVSLTGTIKDFNCYHGVYQTQLTRCVIKAA